MNLDLTPDQQAIREEAARFLRAQSSSEAVRRVVEAGGGLDKELWLSVSRELGWCGMAIPEEFGGLGLGATEVMLLQELSGARLACMPLWSTVCVAAPLVLAAGSGAALEELLPAIAAGEIAITVAFPAMGSAEPFDGTLPAASSTADGFLLDGRFDAVIDLPAADVVIVPGRLPDGTIGLFRLDPRMQGKVTPHRTLDGTRPVASYQLAGVQAERHARIDRGGLTSSVVAKAIAFAQLGLAAEQLGAARGAMDTTLSYIADRVQFGRSIASFQAIKHRCAKLEVDFAEARSLVYGAAARFSVESSADLLAEIAGARLLATELAFRASEEAIQMHGGVGFTWEYDPHLYFKRAQASSVLLGRPDAQLDRIYRLLETTGATP